jgi:hypothetical protein
MIRSVRWNKYDSDALFDPESEYYKDSNSNIYFDYNNKVDLYNSDTRNYLSFARYNNECYNPQESAAFNNVRLTS